MPAKDEVKTGEQYKGADSELFVGGMNSLGLVAQWFLRLEWAIKSNRQCPSIKVINILIAPM